MNDMGACRNCAGEQWVCENHQDRPWAAGTPESCECGAGAPCPVCRPDLAHGWLLSLLRSAHARIDGIERDNPSLIDYGESESLTDKIERALEFYSAGRFRMAYTLTRAIVCSWVVA